MRQHSADPVDCRAVRELIEPWLDDELPASDAEALAAHVAACPGCAGEVELARTVSAALRDLPELEPPRRVTATALGRSRRASRWREMRLPLAASLLIAALGGALWWQQRDHGTVRPLSAQMPGADPSDPEQVERAAEQVRWTLARLGAVEQRAGAATLKVVGDGLERAASRALDRSPRSALPSEPELPPQSARWAQPAERSPA